MTFSVVAFDEITGALGVGVASHSVAVGSRVPHVQSHVGAVATQALTETSYGVRLIEGLIARRDPGEILQGLTAADPGVDHRQVAVIDGKGRWAGLSGDRCLPFAAQLAVRHASAQGNLLASADVVPAMMDAYQLGPVSIDHYTGARGHLAERLLNALDAGELAGGDVRGARSAAVTIAWPDSVRLDVRVDDDARPLMRLRPLVQRGFDQQVVGAAQRAALLGASTHDARSLAEALTLIAGRTQRDERALWAAVLLLRCGETQRARGLLSIRLLASSPTLIEHLTSTNLLPRGVHSLKGGLDDATP